MSALSIQPVYPIFTDIDGQPLEAGYVWIGTANLDPQTNPINVYWDAALTILAPQPIRTLAGYPSRNGTPARLYVNSDYSIRVMNKNGSSVYSAPTATERYSDAVVSGVNAQSVVYDPPFVGGVQTNAEEWFSKAIRVTDFGADPTGAVSSVTAFNNALANGGTVYVPSGTYKLDSRVEMTVDGTTLWLAADVTLLLSGVPATQSPFGNQIHVYANNCSVVGSGPSSLLQITGGSQANAVGVLHHTNFTVRDLTIDGDKANGVAITDDTFMSGVSVVATVAGGALSDVQATIDNCIIKNFLQYGVNVYGEQANGVKVINCNIREIGKLSDPLSVGAGIVVTRGCSDFIASNNVIKNCKQNGMFFSSAGLDSALWTITGNAVHQNGVSGIAFLEQSNYGSVSNKGIFNVAVTGNSISGNGRSGIQLNVDTVGYLKYFTITGNTSQGNVLAGIEANTTNTSPNIVADLQISGNLCLDNGVANYSVIGIIPRVEGISRPFTPTITGSVTPGSATYGVDSPKGTYQKVGNVVYYQLEANWSAHTGTGDLVVGGFPYAANNSEPQPSGWVWANSLTITGQGSLGLVAGQTSGTLFSVNNGTASPVALDTAASLRINGFYFTE